ncbi:hypothetical protein NH340_JMT02071 [Sarcoptes scabiei]|nr:hypothetical protein NH340_JMT02071 [Sarcoptes scabiei]
MNSFVNSRSKMVLSDKVWKKLASFQSFSSSRSTTILERTSIVPITIDRNHSIGERFYSADNRRNKSFFGQVIDNLRQELSKSKEMEESLKKFREEAQKLEESDALKKARKKFQIIESETSKSSQQIKEQIDSIKQKLSKGLEEAQKTEIGRKSIEELSKQAKKAAEQIEQISKSEAFQAVSKTVKTVKDEIGETPFSGAYFYNPPKKLRKRKDSCDYMASRPIQPNEDATGVELHKDSKWFSSWQNFKDNNPYVHKIFDLKTRYDESDNPIVRASRLVTDKMSELFGGMFTKTELSEVLTEICKVDPDFDRFKFIKDCETDIVPNILEALIRGDLEVLQDWCYEGVFNVLITPIKQAQTMGYRFESRILDLTNVDLEMGKMMEQGPVLIITFQTQQIMCVRDAKGNVVEGDPEKIIKVNYIWVLCRDQNELDPRAAWRLLDLSANTSEQWL